MRHLDLFSGIGGFALAASWAWGDEHEIVAFCDIEPFSQAVLKKHWPEAKIYGDIRDLTAQWLAADAHDREQQEQQERDPTDGGRAPESRGGPGPGTGLGTSGGGYSQGVREHEPGSRVLPQVDLLTGGFPCQPFSTAGKKRGRDDDRHLWPEMLRVIREVRPHWVIGENVAGLINMAEFEGVCTGLEAAGYEVQPFIIPACAVDAPHRRDRVWIVAHAGGTPEDAQPEGGSARDDSAGQQDSDAAHADREWKSQQEGSERQERGRAGDLGEESLTHTPGGRLEHRAGEQSVPPAESTGRETEAASRQDSHAPDSTSSGWREGESERGGPREGAGTPPARRRPSHGRSAWDESWLEVATRLCTLDDGLPSGMVRPRGWRNAALKGAGNAIVPQVAYEIMMAIKATRCEHE